MKMSDPTLNQSIISAFSGSADDPARISAFYFFAAGCFWNYEDSFLQFKAKALDARSWATDELTLRGLLASPAYRAAWRMARTGLHSDYRDYLDRLMNEVEPREPANTAQIWRAYFDEERARIRHEAPPGPTESAVTG